MSRPRLAHSHRSNHLQAPACNPPGSHQDNRSIRCRLWCQPGSHLDSPHHCLLAALRCARAVSRLHNQYLCFQLTNNVSCWPVMAWQGIPLENRRRYLKRLRWLAPTMQMEKEVHKNTRLCLSEGFLYSHCGYRCRGRIRVFYDRPRGHMEPRAKTGGVGPICL